MSIPVLGLQRIKMTKFLLSDTLLIYSCLLRLRRRGNTRTIGSSMMLHLGIQEWSSAIYKRKKYDDLLAKAKGWDYQIACCIYWRNHVCVLMIIVSSHEEAQRVQLSCYCQTQSVMKQVLTILAMFRANNIAPMTEDIKPSWLYVIQWSTNSN